MNAYMEICMDLVKQGNLARAAETNAIINRARDLLSSEYPCPKCKGNMKTPDGDWCDKCDGAAFDIEAAEKAL